MSEYGLFSLLVRILSEICSSLTFLEGKLKILMFKKSKNVKHKILFFLSQQIIAFNVVFPRLEIKLFVDKEGLEVNVFLSFQDFGCKFIYFRE